jgi:integrase
MPAKDGTIRKRKDGRWEAIVIVGYDHEGQPIKKSVYGARRQDVLEKRDQALLKAKAGIVGNNDKETLYAAVCSYYEHYMKPNYRGSSAEIFEGLIENYIKPSKIAGMKIGDLKPDQIQAFINDIAEKRKGPTIRRTLQLVNSTLKHNAIQRVIFINPCDFVKKPKPKEDHTTLDDEPGADKVFSHEEQQKLISHCLHEESDKKLACAILLALGTGMRIGEVCGLRNVDFDEVGKRVNIRASLRIVKNIPILQQPKTKESRRTIPITDFAYEGIKAYKKYRNAEELKAGTLYDKETIYFLRTSTGGPVDRRNLLRGYQRLLKRIDLPEHNFHALRHTYATNLLEAGEQIKTVQELLGHANPVITMTIYSHVRPNVKESAIEKLNSLYPIVK